MTDDDRLRMESAEIEQLLDEVRDQSAAPVWARVEEVMRRVVSLYGAGGKVDSAATDVQSAIQRATGQLPSDLPSPPTFVKTNPNDQPVTYIALTSDTLTDGDLYKYATTQVQQRINILPGVSQVQVFGVKNCNATRAAERLTTIRSPACRSGPSTKTSRA